MSQIQLGFMEAKRKKKCKFLCTIFFWCVVVICQYHLNVKKSHTSSFYRYFSNLRLHSCGILYTRFHTFYDHMKVELYIDAFIHLYGGEKQVC